MNLKSLSQGRFFFDLFYFNNPSHIQVPHSFFPNNLKTFKMLLIKRLIEFSSGQSTVGQSGANNSA
jgi:hypothetical protein